MLLIFGLLVGIFFCAATPTYAQQQVSGKVTDESTGEPLPGVNVFISELQTGAATDEEGDFLITNIEPGTYTLVASFIGYERFETTIDLSADENLTLDIQLGQGSLMGEDVVVVGYGEQRRSDMTGSISSVSKEELQEVSMTSLDQGLQGRAAGVYVTQSGNKPGDGAEIRIRGNRSFAASNEPLYVVDGVPISDGLRDINPQDVESVEVLKDASATAIYGARGSNGVVLISTTRGYDGSLSVEYNGSVGFSRALNKFNMMSGPEWAEMKREAWRATGAYTNDEDLFHPTELENLQNGEWTDYQSMILGTGVEHNHQLGISGGTSNTRFYVSFGGLQETGIIETEDFGRYNTRINIDIDINDNIRIGTSTLGSYSIQNGNDRNFLSEAISNSPLTNPYDEEGNLKLQPKPDAQRSNPLIEILPETYVDETKRQRLFTNIYGEFQLSDNLEFRMNFAPDIRHEREGDFQATRSRANLGGPPTAQKDESFTFEYTWENIVQYQQDLTENQAINLTGLFSIQEYQQETSGVDVRGLPASTMEHHNFSAAEEILGAESSFSKWSLVSSMARANYNYDDRYLLTVTGRVDGSSRFGENHKYGIFPSAALGWNIANENFFGDSYVLNDLRLRLSWGKTGQTGIDPYQTQGLLGRTQYNFGSNAAFGYQPDQIRNDDLKWETTSTLNLGLQFEMFNSRVAGDINLYQQNTTDLLLERQLPTTSGFGSILENIGSTRNTGVEFMVSTQNIRPDAGIGSFQWTTDLNLAFNKEEIVELHSGRNDDVGNRWFIGQPIDVHYDLEKIGIWQTSEEQEANSYGRQPGEIKIKDQNGDGNIDADDRRILGQEMPKVSGGLTNRFNYKGFQLSVFLVARFGNMIHSSLHESDRNALVGRYNNLSVDYWTPDNPTNDNPRPTIGQERPVYNQTRGYFDGSYIKVRSINLGYTLPHDLIQNAIGAQSLRIYVNAEQPFMFAPYVQRHNGIDPETSIGVNTPSQWTLLTGINLTF